MAYNNAVFQQLVIEKLNGLFLDRTKEIVIATQAGGGEMFLPVLIVRVGIGRDSNPRFEMWPAKQYDPDGKPVEIFKIHDVLGSAKYIVERVDLFAVDGAPSINYHGQRMQLDAATAVLINARKNKRYEPFEITFSWD